MERSFSIPEALSYSCNTVLPLKFSVRKSRDLLSHCNRDFVICIKEFKKCFCASVPELDSFFPVISVIVKCSLSNSSALLVILLISSYISGSSSSEGRGNFEISMSTQTQPVPVIVPSKGQNCY